uniref:ABC transporter n=1 Tax=Ascaris lumbricoides TaxID=6252 RepID=A0A0M3IW37_ASCLU
MISIATHLSQIDSIFCKCLTLLEIGRHRTIWWISCEGSNRNRFTCGEA